MLVGIFRQSGIMFAALGAIALLAAAGGPAEAEQPIVIGAHIPLTGPSSELG